VRIANRVCRRFSTMWRLATRMISLEPLARQAVPAQTTIRGLSSCTSPRSMLRSTFNSRWRIVFASYRPRQTRSSVRFVHPPREQTCIVPPPPTSIGAIGAPHARHCRGPPVRRGSAGSRASAPSRKVCGARRRVLAPVERGKPEPAVSIAERAGYPDSGMPSSRKVGSMRPRLQPGS